MKEKLNTYFFWSVCTVAFTIPLFPRALPALILLAGLLWIAAVRAKEKWENLKKNISYFFIHTGLFWIYLLSMLYTENQAEGWMKIETSLSLLIFPLIFISFFSKTKNKITEKAIQWFIYGCITAVISCFSYALFFYIFPEVAIANKWSDYDYKFYFFWKSRLSPFLHTTYISMYLSTAILFLLFNASSAFSKKLSMFLITLFSITILLLSSRAGLITLGLLWIVLIYKTLVIEREYKTGVLILFLILSIFSGLYFKSEQFYLRVSSMFSVFSHSANENPAIEKSLVRFEIWPVAFETGMQQLPLGSGIGDANDVLNHAFVENGIALKMERSLNAHNQFLQTFLATGIPGACALLLLLFMPFYFSMRDRNWAYLSFLLIVIINFLFESMLQTQAGVIYFAFMNSLLFSEYLKK